MMLHQCIGAHSYHGHMSHDVCNHGDSVLVDLREMNNFSISGERNHVSNGVSIYILDDGLASDNEKHMPN